jgi:hypothetical protein
MNTVKKSTMVDQLAVKTNVLMLSALIENTVVTNKSVLASKVETNVPMFNVPVTMIAKLTSVQLTDAWATNVKIKFAVKTNIVGRRKMLKATYTLISMPNLSVKKMNANQSNVLIMTIVWMLVMDLVHTNVKPELVSRLNADTTITVLKMLSVPIWTILAIQSNARDMPCAKKRLLQVTSTQMIVPQVNANVLNINVNHSNVEPTPIVMLKKAWSVILIQNHQQETDVTRFHVLATTCAILTTDQSVKQVAADVRKINVSQYHAVTILTVMKVKSVLVNVSITQTSMVLISSMVKNQTHVSKSTVKDTMTVAKKKDAMVTNVYQFNVLLKNTVANRNSVEMQFAKKLNAVTIHTAKAFSMKVLHTSVSNNNVKLLNVQLLNIVAKEVFARNQPTHVTNQSVRVMPHANWLLVVKLAIADVNSKRMMMVPMLVTNVSKLNAEPMTIVQKLKNFVTMKLTRVREFNVLLMSIVTKRMAIKNVSPTNVKR